MGFKSFAQSAGRFAGAVLEASAERARQESCRSCGRYDSNRTVVTLAYENGEPTDQQVNVVLCSSCITQAAARANR